jgi:HME family heavy-metal exporter
MNWLIRFSLQHRLLVVSLALLTMVLGTQTLLSLPIDIFPNLTRPRVTVMTEAPGLSPEEVETLVTFPLETAFNGAAGVQAVRSSSGIGLSVIYIEFDWNTDIYVARQIVNERLAPIIGQLPEGVRPELAPISSIMGQIMMVGLYSKNGTTSPLEVRTLADWVVRPRLLTIPGVAQVITMGGGRKQFQVLVDPDKLTAFQVTLPEVEEALRKCNQNATGGYIEQGSREYLVRSIGRIQNMDDLKSAVVKATDTRSVVLSDVATIREGAQAKRGDSSVDGHAAVVLTVAKQPQADTRRLTEAVSAALEDLRSSLPADVVIEGEIYQQREFIDRGVDNVIEALRDGAILIVIVLILFLMNVRTTFITLTAIPLSIVITGLFFHLTGMSINVMTLGGLAVAMGELVDDAIVDIENVFRRLTQNAALANPRPELTVIYEASLEVRGAIVYGTALIILVFIPLFALSGIEGRLFAPLGIAYIVSILASLLISLTVTPVLGSLLLTGRSLARHGAVDSPLLRFLKGLAGRIVRISLHTAGLGIVLLGVGLSMAISTIVLLRMGTDFLPAFDEGAAQVNVVLPPGSSLEASNRASGMVDRAFKKHLASDEQPQGIIRHWVRRSGRAELDEHAEGVNITEYIVTLNPESGVSRAETLATLREELNEIPGIEYEAEQPLAHLISHMLSGVSAQIAVKLYGDDLNVLRQKAEQIKAAVADVKGLAPPVVEPQQLIPQVRIDLNREQLQAYGLTAGDVNDLVETALNGRIVSTILDGQRTFDLVVRLQDDQRVDLDQIERLKINLPKGGSIPISAIAKVYEAAGPNMISRENVRRRITIRCNTTDRDLGSVVADMKKAVAAKVELPEGYFIEYGGQFEAQQEAARTMAMLSLASLAGVFLVLYTLFPSVRIVLQIMFALPAAFVGGVAALALTGQTLSVASMVGFISLGGIAARNGILLVSHYIHLMREEGEGFTAEMVMRGSLERLAPVLMTALTAGIGLIPLVLGGHQPGKEILYPVATVILGGLITCTICEYVVHPGIFFRFSGKDALRIAHRPSGMNQPDLSENLQQSHHP